jgi:hypothetical protein
MSKKMQILAQQFTFPSDQPLSNSTRLPFKILRTNPHRTNRVDPLVLILPDSAPTFLDLSQVPTTNIPHFITCLVHEWGELQQSIQHELTQSCLNLEQEQSIYNTTRSQLQSESCASQELEASRQMLHDLHLAEVVVHTDYQSRYTSILTYHSKLVSALSETYSCIPNPSPE